MSCLGYRVLGAGCVAYSLSFAGSATAAEWNTSAGVTPGLVYTDNVCLSGDDEQDRWIATVTPDFSVSGVGKRAKFSLSTAVEINNLTDDDLEELGCSPASFSDREQFAPRARANGNVELVKDWFFIDADASIDQNQASPFLGAGDDGFNRRGNTNTTYRYAVSPYINRRLDDAAQLFLRYSYDDQRNSRDSVGDSNEERVTLRLDSGDRFTSFIWGVEGNYSELQYDDIDGRSFEENTLASGLLTLGYNFSSSWQINASYGHEDNNFFTTTRDDVDGDIWDVGLRWTPNSRVLVEAGGGHRFFGTSPRFKVQYRHKRHVLAADYARNVTYDRNIRTYREVQSTTDAFGDTIEPNTGEPLDLSNDSVVSNQNPIVDERFTLAWAFRGRRTSISVSGSHSDQTRLDNNSNSVFTYARVGFNRSLSRSLSVNTALSYDEQQAKDSDLIGDSDTFRANLGVSARLTESTTMRLIYQYTDRSSDRSFDDYQENRVTLNLRISL